MRICNLREKQVINSADCKILGYVQDVEFDLCSGCIKAIIVPGPPKLFCFFGADCEYVIPFECIVNVGPDVILVELKGSRCTDRCKRREREKNHCCC